MFRFSIRELLTLTLSTGLAVGWWLDHRANAANAEAAEDAKFLAQVAEHGCHCQMVNGFEKLREKYGVKPALIFAPIKWQGLQPEIDQKRKAEPVP